MKAVFFIVQYLKYFYCPLSRSSNISSCPLSHSSNVPDCFFSHSSNVSNCTLIHSSVPSSTSPSLQNLCPFEFFFSRCWFIWARWTKAFQLHALAYSFWIVVQPYLVIKQLRSRLKSASIITKLYFEIALPDIDKFLCKFVTNELVLMLVDSSICPILTPCFTPLSVLYWHLVLLLYQPYTDSLFYTFICPILTPCFTPLSVLY